MCPSMYGHAPMYIGAHVCPVAHVNQCVYCVYVGQGLMPALVLHHSSLYITNVGLQQNRLSSLAS